MPKAADTLPMSDPLKSLDLLALVFRHLPPSDVVRAGATAKLWHQAAREPSVWAAQTRDLFAAAPMTDDPRIEFRGRWQASAAALQALSVPATRLKSPEALQRETAAMARPHRVEVARYVLERTEMAMGLRLNMTDVAAGAARAEACVDPRDRADITNRGRELLAHFTSKRISRRRTF